MSTTHPEEALLPSLKRLVLGIVLVLTALGLAPSSASATSPETVLFNQASARCPSGPQDGPPTLVVCDDAHSPGKWEFTPVPGFAGVVTINNHLNTAACLGTFDGGTTVKACNGTTNQQWRVTAYQSDPGSTPLYDLVGVRLLNVQSSQCLDNTEHRIGGGWRLYIFGCNNGPYQQWNITKPAFKALTGGHPGMTWANLEQRPGNLVHVGYDSASDPYNGDTTPVTALPLLCLSQDGRPAPAGIPTSGYHSWVGGQVKATAPLPGTLLTSRAVADQTCANTFGAGWRMAEFHDASGWGFWANGTLPTGVRFWTAINDQPANPWS
ncbi:RICIN domain-containing protein [Kitasatospora sp. NPDC101801]|uniref:RICIN domain-containing protein n=1 Tax=Kitasatospora sp. NPDC101801 TaxID=3364103 RepID=UPI0037F6B702